jgi:hypothetical protein
MDYNIFIRVVDKFERLEQRKSGNFRQNKKFKKLFQPTREKKFKQGCNNTLLINNVSN